MGALEVLQRGQETPGRQLGAEGRGWALQGKWGGWAQRPRGQKATPRGGLRCLSAVRLGGSPEQRRKPRFSVRFPAVGGPVADLPARLRALCPAAWPLVVCCLFTLGTSTPTFGQNAPAPGVGTSGSSLSFGASSTPTQGFVGVGPFGKRPVSPLPV